MPPSPPKPVATADGTMWLRSVGPDRQQRVGNEGLNACATVTVNGGRRTMHYNDVMNMAETGTPVEKKFASEVLTELHKYESHPPADQSAMTYPSPATTAPAATVSLAPSAPAPSP